MGVVSWYNLTRLSRAMCKKQLLFIAISDLEKRTMSLVVHLQFSKFWTPNWRSGKPMIFNFDDLWSMGTSIKLFTTTSLNFCPRLENVKELRSYEKTLIKSLLLRHSKGSCELQGQDNLVFQTVRLFWCYQRVSEY